MTDEPPERLPYYVRMKNVCRASLRECALDKWILPTKCIEGSEGHSFNSKPGKFPIIIMINILYDSHFISVFICNPSFYSAQIKVS